MTITNKLNQALALDDFDNGIKIKALEEVERMLGFSGENEDLRAVLNAYVDLLAETSNGENE
jgi:hypothetical protein